ncbi:sulfurtransferase [Limnobacter humi]|uniref:Sulfurtransferase n=1 Tax=Limnobacter humi TaxID=1778671 RepID=A0ABT1WEX9_9BURK|nr:sulfurtransferase [Limnobacter humi]MCQ8896083.1 sulfurtransferase [Limnobacter humi]
MQGPLITPADLDILLQMRDRCVIFDCRFELMNPSAGRRAYAAGHIPGAHYLSLDDDLSDHTRPLAGRHPLPTAHSFEQLMRQHGVDAQTRLVAYDQGDHAMAARFWWLARYFGHQSVQVLNGGIAQWQAQGFDLVCDPSELPVQLGRFNACEQPRLRVAYADLIQQQALTVLVDARDKARYTGEVEPIDPVAGHIPGAINMPWKLNLNTDGWFKTPEQLLQVWEPVMPDLDRAVVYCGSGVTACVNLLALACLGHGDIPLFPGSWSEWCQRNGPVETSM